MNEAIGTAARRMARAVRVGKVTMGGTAPVVVQSMTNTDTADVAATSKQVGELWRAGSELVRITVNTPEAAAAVPRIRDKLAMMGVDVPLIGDFHYNGHQLLSNEPAAAQALAKYRINPGNVGFGHKRDTQFATLIELALKHDKPVRIGVNWGSLDQALAAKLMDANHERAQPWDPALAVVYRSGAFSAETHPQPAWRHSQPASNTCLARDLPRRIRPLPPQLGLQREDPPCPTDPRRRAHRPHRGTCRLSDVLPGRPAR